MMVAMQYGGGAMQFEHILEIAAQVLDMVPFIMLEIVKKNCFTKMSEEKKQFDDCGKIVDRGTDRNNAVFSAKKNE